MNEAQKKAKESVWRRFQRAVAGSRRVDETLLDTLEETLLAADVGIELTLKIIEGFEKRVHSHKYLHAQELRDLLKAELRIWALKASPADESFQAPAILTLVGVNGVGKTTSVAKLAYHYKQQGKKVILGAADTFRAAAVEQLHIHGDRLSCPVVSKPHGSDPAAVAFDTVRMAKEKGYDIAIIDTAGRLHNKAHLMQELSRIYKSIQKASPGAPHAKWLVLDATTGANADKQTKIFQEIALINGLIFTKLDGTAKGGMLLHISHHYGIPVRFVGVGEGKTDLRRFDADRFIDAFVPNW